MELEARVMVLAGRQRRAPETARFRVPAVIMRRERFLEPADLGPIKRRHDPACVTEGIGRIRVRQDVDLPADRGTHRLDTCNIVRGRIAEAQLQRLVALGRDGQRLLDEFAGRLVAKRNPTRIGRDVLRAPPEQTMERPANGLAPDIPERHVDPARRDRGRRPHAVAGELHLVDPVPDADDITRLHPGDE